MVASGALEPSALATNRVDDRALVTVRIPGGADVLQRAGIAATALTGPFAQVRVDRRELAKLIAISQVESIEERRMLHPLLDRSTVAINAVAARASTGLDGTGVLVATIDTGIDFHHADFRNADGSTRIAALLDFATPADGRHTDLGNYTGAIWLQDEIDQALAGTIKISELDVNGHGTHVSGIAAGNGLATGNGFAASRYVGVAPSAQLIVVQATESDGSSFTDGDVLTACRFAVERAAALAKPVAISLSLGGAGGPHDGSSALEQGIDMLLPADGAGRAIAIAAGNDGGRDIHSAGYDLHGSTRFRFQVTHSNIASAALAIELWVSGNPSVSLIAPSGKQYGPAATGHSFDTTTSEGHVSLDNTSGVGGDGLTDVGVTVIGATGGAPAEGAWTIVLGGTLPRWDAWIVETPADADVRFLDQISEDERCALPATAHNAIVVGSFGTRGDWTSVAGEMLARNVPIDDASYFSSTGPTYDGRFVPDLIAPGEYIVSSLSTNTDSSKSSSAFFVAGDPTLGIVEDGVHGVLRGTSQAAPHVAGAMALLFQADSTLTPNRIREILRATTIDSGAGFSPKAGFGRLDVAAALGYIRGTRGGMVSADRSSVGVSRDLLPPGDGITLVSVTPRDIDGVALGPGHQVEIALSAGEPMSDVTTASDDGGRYERSFIAHAALGAEGVTSVMVDGIPLTTHRSVFFVPDRRDVGHHFEASGGCALAPHPAETSNWGWVVFLFAILLRRLHRLALSPIVRANMHGSRLILVVIFGAALFGLGCGHDIGDNCVTNVDCSPFGDRFCDTSEINGYCTIDGCNVSSCPSEAVCVRFFTPLAAEPCRFNQNFPSDRSDCARVDERCLCDTSKGTACDCPGGLDAMGVCMSPNGHCAPESTERRWCQYGCYSDDDCRVGYECRPTGSNGAEGVPVTTDAGVTSTTNVKFCAPKG